MNIIKALIAAILITIAFYTGMYTAQGSMMSELENMNRAALYEDGSWRIEYNSGHQVTGCMTGGLCED